MYRTLANTFLLTVALATLCWAGSQNDGYLDYLTPTYLHGTWNRVIMVPSKRDPGMYYKQVISYQIRELNPPERRVLSALMNNEVVKKPLMFIVWYDVGYIKGYIYDADAPEFDTLSFLKYTALIDLGNDYQIDTVTFRMPVADSLIVQTGSEYFGLRKRR